MAITTIRGARIFDGEALSPWASVRFSSDGILACGNNDLAQPGDTIVDAMGAVLLPGLIDAHTHLLPGALQQALIFGVTTELDMFSQPELVRELRAEVAGSDQLADFRSAGIGATAPGGHPSVMYAPFPYATGPEQADAFVEARITEGSDYLKVIYDADGASAFGFPSLDRSTLNALVHAAHTRGLAVIAHTTTTQSVAHAVSAGVDVLAHVPLDSPLPADVVAEAVDRRIALTPTLATIEVACGRPGGSVIAGDDSLRPYLGPFWAQSLERGLTGPPPGHPLPDYAVAQDNVRRYAEAGGVIFAGTDCPNPGTVHGASQHRELELLVECGLDPLDALRAATSAPAHRFGLADRGRIAVGLRADLVLVDGDPARDITQTRLIRYIWRSGTPCVRSSFVGSTSEQQEIVALQAQVQKVMDWVRERWPGAVPPE